MSAPDPITVFPMLRQSLLSSFDACALSSKFSQDLEGGWSTHEQARGTVFHAVAAKCMREMALHGEQRIDAGTAQAILVECLRQDDIDRTCPVCDGPAERQMVEGMPKVVCEAGHTSDSSFVNLPMKEVKDLWWTVAKWANDNVWDIDCLIDVEQRLYATVSYPDGAGGHVDRIITGQLDVVFSDPADIAHAVVVDYKTGWKLPPPADLSFSGYFQQRVYALVVMESYPAVNRVTTSELYVYHSESRSATIWREDLPEIRDELAALVARFDRSVRDDAWAPTPGKACDWCVKPQACPIPQIARGEGRITTEDEAATVAAQLVVAEAVTKKAKAALSAWASAHGPQQVRDAKGPRVWGHRKTKSVSRPTREELQKEVQAALQEGREPNFDGLYRERVGTKFLQFVPTAEDLQPEVDTGELVEALQASVAQSVQNDPPADV